MSAEVRPVITDLVAELDALFAAVPEREWESPAANVGWNCWRTADHISGDFAHYAAQIVGQPRDHYVKFSFDTSRATTPDELREVVRVAGAYSPQRCARPAQAGWPGIRTGTSRPRDLPQSVRPRASSMATTSQLGSAGLVPRPATVRAGAQHSVPGRWAPGRIDGIDEPAYPNWPWRTAKGRAATHLEL